jgi:ABC-type multidrug transport system ATPase subunit
MKNVTGTVLYNGNPYRSDFARTIGYCDQIDEFLPSNSYTVMDHLTFIGDLRLPSHMSRAQRMKTIHNLMSIFGLFYCSTSPLFLCSGGERKRTNLCAELLSLPSLLLIDEGTSGLDSGAAMSLMELLRNLANQGLPIIQSIHQPSNQIVSTFDKIMIISNGSIVYYGKSYDIESYLNSIDYYLPPNGSSSPVDFLLQALYSDATTPIEGFYLFFNFT